MITSRLFLLSLFLLALFGALLFRLFTLQIVEGPSTYQTQYLATTLTKKSEPGTRGQIYDRSGKLLAYNQLTYAVTLQDTGAYANGYEKNLMILRLLDVLDRHSVRVISDLKIGVDSAGRYVFTSSGEEEHKRFLRDVYGLTTVRDLDQPKADGTVRYSTAATPDEIVQMMVDRYGIGKYGRKAADGTYEVSPQHTIDLINVRFALAQIAYRKYESLVVASGVDEATVGDVLEHANELLGVDIKEQYVRVYNDSVFFAHLIGYTGRATSDDVEYFSDLDPDAGYNVNDVVGKSGIERSLELTLQGKKGRTEMYVDSSGRVTEIVSQTEPQAGNDVTLTVDRDLTVGLYLMIEQHIAGIIADKLRNYDVVIVPGSNARDKLIGIKEVYGQLISNNVLDYTHFGAYDASDAEKSIYGKYTAERERVFEAFRVYLADADGTPYEKLSDEMKNYVDQYLSILTSRGYLPEDKIELTDSVYQDWLAGKIALRAYLEHAISENWLDTGKLKLSGRYTSMADTFKALTEAMEDELSENVTFSKRIYRTLIDGGVISGNEVCLALFDQGVLAPDEAAYNSLRSGGSDRAFTFMVNKINNIEITPAQLALDLCSASVILTDPRNGQVMAMVSYPGYDNNELSGTINSKYYQSLLNDQSLPLLNRATQVRTAPGSIFKVVSATAGLEEHAIADPYEIIHDDEIFTKAGYDLRCWIYPNGTHGDINVMEAIRDSCNYFFSEVAYRLASKGEDYSEARGLEILQKYAAMYGLNQKSGVQVAEIEPHVTDFAVVPSSIGQGTNAFANIQLSRYVTTIASRGNLYEFNLVSKVAAADGTVLSTYEPKILSYANISNETWNAIYTGMRMVITSGATARLLYRGCDIEVAGKTGTAQQDLKRPNHATFIGFAPYQSPQVAVAVQIPYGYTSTNSAKLGREALEYYFGEITLQEIMARGASKASTIVIQD
ncbi:MAG: penicillin-binding protein [Lachnospiraceae bacterium]|nr:penicillin-binding protein [Lachnospiraceae bacterium]